MNNDQIKVIFAEEEHTKYAEQIVTLIYESALQRGTGIARRTPEYIAQKIRSGKAVVALCDDRLIGFSYIESWEHGDYVATSGLIVDPEFRRWGSQHESRPRHSNLPASASRSPNCSVSPLLCR